MTTFNLGELTDSVADGQVAAATEITQKALAAKVPAKDILDNGLLPAMNRVGKDFEDGQIFLPELLMAGDAMKASVELLRPELSGTGAAYAGKYVIGTVEGDLHDIGKNIVILMLEGNGWEVTDLGRDIPPQRFCEEIEKGSYDILGLSALLTFTLPKMPETINLLKEAGLRNKVKIMVGGVPLNQSFADQIGADAYARDAVEAVVKAKELLKK
jgi:5-methyltetrahydrofolate--homocysteine methyltransferase